MKRKLRDTKLRFQIIDNIDIGDFFQEVSSFVHEIKKLIL